MHYRFEINLLVVILQTEYIVVFPLPFLHLVSAVTLLILHITLQA